jgi:hypothetical protein
MIDAELIGMEKQAAIDLLEKKGTDWRILGEDGETFMGTCDWKPLRITLYIQDGKVSSVRRG